MNINGFGIFSADVWGTVSDWTGVAVTIIGTLYVVKTFRQQQKINAAQLALNKEQKELNRLAMEQDRRALMPTFKFRTESDETSPLIWGKLYVTDSSARNVMIYPIEDKHYKQPIYSTIYRCIVDSPHGEIELNLKKNESNNFEIQYVVYFEDEVGRPYVQHLGSQNNKSSIIIPLPVEKDFATDIIGKNHIF